MQYFKKEDLELLNCEFKPFSKTNDRLYTYVGRYKYYECKNCERFKQREQFYIKETLTLGVVSYCKKCMIEKNAPKPMSITEKKDLFANTEQVNFSVKNTNEVWYYIGNSYEWKFYKKYDSRINAVNAINESLSERISKNEF